MNLGLLPPPGQADWRAQYGAGPNGGAIFSRQILGFYPVRNFLECHYVFSSYGSGGAICQVNNLDTPPNGR